MKAFYYENYGPPEGLELKDVPKPVPKADEVLVKIHATSLNASDYEMLRGIPMYARIWGFFKPKYPILGSDVAGTVEAVGDSVTTFKPGDEVFGDLFEYWGGLAEYVSAPEKLWLHKPSSISFEEVSALPQAAVIALQGLQKFDKNCSNQHILINGAGGSGGTYAIQLAKLYGAIVTGIDNGSKLEKMLSLGADHVIDYQKDDFTKYPQRYDLIFDLVAHRSLFDYKKVLKPNGRYLVAGGAVKRILEVLIIGSLISIFGSKKFSMLAVRQNKDDLKHLLELVETKKIKPIIDRIYPFEETPEAFRRLIAGQAFGKVIIKML